MRAGLIRSRPCSLPRFHRGVATIGDYRVSPSTDAQYRRLADLLITSKCLLSCGGRDCLSVYWRGRVASLAGGNT